MLTTNVLSRTKATVESVSSLTVSLKRHPNFVKSSNQLEYLVLVQIKPPSSPDRLSGESDRIVSLATSIDNLESAYPIEFVHGYLSELPSKITARNENCALLARNDTVRPLIEADYTTRSHLIRHETSTDRSAGVGQSDSNRQKKQCSPRPKKITIGDMFAKMQNVKSEKPVTLTEVKDRDTSKSSKMQYGDHEYCSTKYPLVKAFQKQASKIRSTKSPPQPAVKTEDPPPDVSAAGSSKRQWIDTSSSDEEQKKTQPSATSKPLTKRLRPPAKPDSSQPKAEATKLDLVNPKVLSKPNVTREATGTSKRSSRSASKKAPIKSQTRTVLSFVRKPGK